VARPVAKPTNRARRRTVRTAAPSLPYQPWLIDQLKDSAEAAAYLEAVIEEGDQVAVMLALRQVAEAKAASRESLASETEA
jgi:hypothetical protein